MSDGESTHASVNALFWRPLSAISHFSLISDMIERYNGQKKHQGNFRLSTKILCVCHLWKLSNQATNFSAGWLQQVHVLTYKLSYNYLYLMCDYMHFRECCYMVKNFFWFGSNLEYKICCSLKAFEFFIIIQSCANFIWIVLLAR